MKTVFLLYFRKQVHDIFVFNKKKPSNKSIGSMKKEDTLKKDLKPLLDMVRLAKLNNDKEFLQNVESFKTFLIGNNICNASQYPILLDKIFDEIIENN